MNEPRVSMPATVARPGSVTRLLTEVVATDPERRLTAVRFQQLADVPPEIEWFANLGNKSTRRAYENALQDFIQRLYQKHNDRQRGIILFDKSSVEARIQSLARTFKYSGHQWGNSRNYADVPVFLDSRASRLIQLADLVAFALFRFYERSDNRFYDVIKHCFDTDGGVEHGLYVRL